MVRTFWVLVLTFFSFLRSFCLLDLFVFVLTHCSLWSCGYHRSLFIIFLSWYFFFLLFVIWSDRRLGFRRLMDISWLSIFSCVLIASLFLRKFLFGNFWLRGLLIFLMRLLILIVLLLITLFQFLYSIFSNFLNWALILIFIWTWFFFFIRL